VAANLRKFDLALGAGDELALAVSGDFVRLRSSTGELTFFTDGGSRVPMVEGESVRLPAPFAWLRVRNDGAGAVDAVALIGSGEMSKTGTVTQSKPGALDSLADKSCAATAVTQLVAANATRRELLIVNLAAGVETLRIGDSGAAAANGLPLDPGQSMTLTTTAAVYAYNPGAAAQSVALAEVND